MKRAQRIVLPVHTTAPWGGLQDWAVGMVKGLTALGREVALVSNNALVRERAGAAAAVNLDVNWDDWEPTAAALEAEGPWDIVFAQPFGARRMGVEVSRRWGVPMAYMSHGNSSDEGYTWAGAVSLVALASSSLQDTMSAFDGIDPAIVHVLANGASAAFFPERVVAPQERIAPDGTARIVLASRLSQDKLNQIPATRLLVETLLQAPEVGSVSIEVLGGGPMAAVFEAGLSQLTHDPRVRLQMLGWAEEATVAATMAGALFTVGGGVTGTQSLCMGTACLGAGIRSVVGMSTPANRDLVLGSNFGDHRVFRVPELTIVDDVHWFLQPGNYQAFQDAFQPLMRTERTHAAVAERAAMLLDGAVAANGR